MKFSKARNFLSLGLGFNSSIFLAPVQCGGNLIFQKFTIYILPPPSLLLSNITALFLILQGHVWFTLLNLYLIINVQDIFVCVVWKVLNSINIVNSVSSWSFSHCCPILNELFSCSSYYIFSIVECRVDQSSL